MTALTVRDEIALRLYPDLLKAVRSAGWTANGSYVTPEYAPTYAMKLAYEQADAAMKIREVGDAA